MMEEVSIEEDVSIVEGFSLGRGLSNSARPHHSSVDVVSCRLVIVLAEHVDRLDATWLVMLQPSSIHF